MLRNIHDKNPFLLEYIEALKEAITYDGPTGYMELPSLVTTQKSIRAEQDTMTIVVDGREMTVLESTFIVSPNSVPYIISKLKDSGVRESRAHSRQRFSKRYRKLPTTSQTIKGPTARTLQGS